MTGLLHGVQYNVEITCAIIYAVCIFYSCVGGIKAVIWTDAFQALCMFGSYLGIIVYGRCVVLLSSDLQAMFDNVWKPLPFLIDCTLQ